MWYESDLERKQRIASGLREMNALDKSIDKTISFIGEIMADLIITDVELNKQVKSVFSGTIQEPGGYNIHMRRIFEDPFVKVEPEERKHFEPPVQEIQRIASKAVGDLYRNSLAVAEALPELSAMGIAKEIENAGIMTLKAETENADALRTAYFLEKACGFLESAAMVIRSIRKEGVAEYQRNSTHLFTDADEEYQKRKMIADEEYQKRKMIAKQEERARLEARNQEITKARSEGKMWG